MAFKSRGINKYRSKTMGRRKSKRTFRKKTYGRKTIKHIYRNMKPEVKYVTYNQLATFNNRTAISGTLKVGDFSLFNLFPQQGITDLLRIGDTIFVKKYWLKFTLESNAAQNPTCLVRVMIFSLPVPLVTPDVSQFWQLPTINQATMGKPNYEIVKRVYYDKMIKLVSPLAATPHVSNLYNVNLNVNKRMVFNNGTAVPRSSEDQLYIAVVGYAPGGTGGTTDGTTMGTCSFTVSTYFTDA